MSKLQKKILIVDDNASNRETIRLAVQQQEFLNIEVLESENVDAGIQLLEKNTPDIVILDVHMPDKNGFDFLDIMRSDKRYDTIKVIMLSVDDTLKNIFKAENRGIDVYYFLGKPFNITDLQAIVLEICLPHQAIKHSSPR